MRSHAVWNFDAAPWRDRPKTLAQLKIEFFDGTRRAIETDESWNVIESPIVYDWIREGEIVDARKKFGHPLGKKAVLAKIPTGLLESDSERKWISLTLP